MILIDAHTGREAKEGDYFKGIGDVYGQVSCVLPVDPGFKILEIDEQGFLKARILLRFDDGREVWSPLVVRWLYPTREWFLRKIAFIPR